MTVRDRSATLLTRNMADHLLLSPDPSERQVQQPLDAGGSDRFLEASRVQDSSPSRHGLPEGSHFEFFFVSVKLNPEGNAAATLTFL